ncbi:hypothetical protein D9758_011199 [Tetrapyrgos nigripes]|uniref:Uncharacterized protein n=1 Tax=Tetrapyrgos nigripes TaxID=182062 RepID=A0A8H5D6M3_9AGAR|nr:hypothetical protein D9758_011199 [Tetrapyrgos nigripes]
MLEKDRDVLAQEKYVRQASLSPARKDPRAFHFTAGIPNQSLTCLSQFSISPILAVFFAISPSRPDFWSHIILRFDSLYDNKYLSRNSEICYWPLHSVNIYPTPNPPHLPSTCIIGSIGTRVMEDMYEELDADIADDKEHQRRERLVFTSLLWEILTILLSEASRWRSASLAVEALREGQKGLRANGPGC